MPWNDTRKPNDAPGPWDAPAVDSRGAQEGRPKPDPPGRKTRPSDAGSPWSGGPQETPRREPRRPPSVAPPKAAAPPPARGPHLDELRRQLRAGIDRVARGPSSRRVRIGLVCGLAAGWAASGVYLVANDETAVVTRFGVIVGQTGPGLNYHWPAPFEAARKLPLNGVNRLDLGSADPDDAAAWMLTRDGDLLALAYSVQWRVADPSRYLSGLAEPEAVLRAAAQAGVRQAVAATALADMVSLDHGGVGARAAARIQAKLDRAGAGVKIVGVQVRDVQPPEAAQAAFHDIASAQDDAAAAVRDASAYRGRALSDARADAAKAVQASQGYRDQEISEAKGEAARFALVDAQYRKYPDVTRERLYTETMERVLHGLSKVVVPAAKGGGASIVLPADAFHARPAEVPAPQSPPPAPNQNQGQAAPSQGGAAAAPGAAERPQDLGATGGPTA